MASESYGAKRGVGGGWIATLVGVLVLVAGGFVLGLVVGVVSEEPDLVVGHVAGRSDEVAWAAESGSPPKADLNPSVSTGPSFGRPSEPEPTARVADAEPALEKRLAPDRIGPPAVSAPPPEVAREPTSTTATRTTPASPTAASADSEVFAIQVGAFGDAASARTLAGRLEAKGYATQLIEPSSDDRWRVRVGPITGQASADRTARKLKMQEQLPTWVLREQGR